jgi:hypothetical protein
MENQPKNCKEEEGGIRGEKEKKINFERLNHQ